MRRLAAFFSIFLLLAFGALPPAEGLTPSASNAGFTGLWEYPSALMPGDGAGWIGLSRYHPYQPYYLNLGYLPWLEFNVRLTRFLTSNPTKSNPSYAWGDYIDKAIDLKVLLARQRGLLPNLAVGATDISGTRILDAEYVVATYAFERAAFTFGYGTERYDGFFGGFEWEFGDWLTFKAEYSPLDYSKDAAYSSTGIAADLGKEKWNAGFVFRLPYNLDASVSYQRGEEWCWGLSYRFDLSRPLFGGRKPERFEPEAYEVVGWDEADFALIAGRIIGDIQNNLGIRDIHVFFGDRRVLVAYENIGHASQAEAMARALLLTAFHLPWDVEELVVVPRVRGQSLVRLSVPGEQCGLLRLQRMNRYDGSGAAVAWTDGDPYGREADESWPLHYGPDGSQKKGRTTAKLMVTADVRIDRPTVKPFFMSRQNLDLVVDHRTSDGWAAHLDIRHPLNNDIDIWWEPYLNDKTRIYKGVLSYTRSFGDGLFAQAEAGWLDELWAGANLWGRKYLGQGDFWVGARASYTHPRDPDKFASLSDSNSFGGHTLHGLYLRYWNPDEWRLSWWAQAGYHENLYDLDLTAEYGRFLNEDKGYRLSAMRWWNGIGLGFYYVVTDIKIPGESYTRVGATLDIPVGAFWGTDSAQRWNEDIRINSAWVYDGGRQPGAWQTPEQLWGQLQPERLRGNLYEELERLCGGARGDGDSQPERPVYGLYDYLKRDIYPEMW